MTLEPMVRAVRRRPDGCPRPSEPDRSAVSPEDFMGSARALSEAVAVEGMFR